MDLQQAALTGVQLLVTSWRTALAWEIKMSRDVHGGSQFPPLRCRIAQFLSDFVTFLRQVRQSLLNYVADVSKQFQVC